MRVVILVPSRNYMSNAGARIRYGRLSAEVEPGLDIQFEDIAQFDPRTAWCDVLLISKCHDARALLAAQIMSRRGMKVGVDLFDDYFSQSDDSRLNRFRSWLGQLLPLCDFAMCSTHLMTKVITQYRDDIPLFVLNDPVLPLNPGHLQNVLAEKLSDAQVEGRFRLAWFGIGDNPHFPVGLSDLAAFADTLSLLGANARSVELSILTNPRALDATRLAMIADLPVRTTVAEWSEVAEADLLRNSLACFLPVNAQRFSTVKSLNRALTALSAGCQVISVGYPLYRDLDDFIYRDVEEFVTDISDGRPRLSGDTLHLFCATIERVASPVRESEAFASFLETVPAGHVDSDSSELFLVHGYASNSAAHKMVQAVGGLSVASPFCSLPLEFDIVFHARPGREVAMLVSDKGLSRLRPHARSRASGYGLIGQRNFWEIRKVRRDSIPLDTWKSPSLSLQLALYPSVMREIFKELAFNFEPGLALIAEDSSIPFESGI